MAWYCCRRAASHYTHWLQKDRYDDQGEDRWQAISEVGRLLFPEGGSEAGAGLKLEPRQTPPSQEHGR